MCHSDMRGAHPTADVENPLVDNIRAHSLVALSATFAYTPGSSAWRRIDDGMDTLQVPKADDLGGAQQYTNDWTTSGVVDRGDRLLKRYNRNRKHIGRCTNQARRRLISGLSLAPAPHM